MNAPIIAAAISNKMFRIRFSMSSNASLSKNLQLWYNYEVGSINASVLECSWVCVCACVNAKREIAWSNRSQRVWKGTQTVCKQRCNPQSYHYIIWLIHTGEKITTPLLAHADPTPPPHHDLPKLPAAQHMSITHYLFIYLFSLFLLLSHVSQRLQ